MSAVVLQERLLFLVLRGAVTSCLGPAQCLAQRYPECSERQLSMPMQKRLLFSAVLDVCTERLLSVACPKSLADKMLYFSAFVVILCDKETQHLVFTVKQLILI